MIMLLLAASLFFTPLFANPDHKALNKELFSSIYTRGSWGNQESRSGHGSSLGFTTLVRGVLPRLLKKLKVKTLIDAGCGDHYWMNTLDTSMLTLYIGVDIVEDMIRDNIEKYGSPTKLFFTADIASQPLPKADAILCRDCMQHLPDECIFAMCKTFKQSKSTYLIASNFDDTVENHDLNPEDLKSRHRINYRNLKIAPFNFPEPIAFFPEGHENKMINVWRIADLPDFN